MSEVIEEYLGIVDAPDTNLPGQGSPTPDPPSPPIATDDEHIGIVGDPSTPKTARQLQ